MNVVPDQPLTASLVGWVEQSRAWILGLRLDDEGHLVAPLPADASWLAECACPDDCNRDHDVE